MRHQVKSVTILLGVILSLSALLILTSTQSAKARYLPTRADDSDVEVLKELIRELVAQSNMEQLESRINLLQLPNRMNGNYKYYHQSTAQQPFQVERRSVEIPQVSTGDTEIRGSAESLFGNINNIKTKSDR